MALSLIICLTLLLCYTNSGKVAEAEPEPESGTETGQKAARTETRLDFELGSDWD